ncbi:hypothetical protein FOA52_015162 [Chlamydomonas sp. UWO 241]|nr:hypothetical protein FOA52_015162 [Chlamydomonas sp. UWO 241]
MAPLSAKARPALLLLVLALLSCGARGAGDAAWLSSECKPPLTSGPVPTLPVCPPPLRQLTEEEVARLGPLLAPRVYMHELDWTHLTDPRAWSEATTVYYGSKNYTLDTLYARFPTTGAELYENVGQQAGLSDLFRSDPHSAAARVGISTDDIKERSHRDGVDAEGASSAHVWFQDFHPTTADGTPDMSSLAFKYWLWYPWNGCSNQVLATTNGPERNALEFYVCPAGVHEGDWEDVSALACVADLISLLGAADKTSTSGKVLDAASIVKRLQLSQHGDSIELDCTTGECERDEADGAGAGTRGVTRHAVYSALHSHAMYPRASRGTVYKKIDLGALPGMDGIYLVDRTSRGGPVWTPGVDNVHWMPPLQRFSDDLSLHTEEYRWALFPGAFGFYQITSDNGVACLAQNATAEGPCTDAPGYASLVQLYGSGSVDGLVWTSDLPPGANLDGGRGPLFRRSEWVAGGTPPQPAECPFTGGGGGDGNSSGGGGRGEGGGGGGGRGGGGGGAGLYPARAGPGCAIANEPVPGFSLFSMLSGVSAIVSSGSEGVDGSCRQAALVNLPACLPDLGLSEGCCSDACWEAVAGESGLSNQCLESMLLWICQIAEARPNDTSVAAFVPAIFRVERRCVSGRATPSNCVDFAAERALPLPESSPGPRSPSSPSPNPPPNTPVSPAYPGAPAPEMCGSVNIPSGFTCLGTLDLRGVPAAAWRTCLVSVEWCARRCDGLGEACAGFTHVTHGPSSGPARNCCYPKATASEGDLQPFRVYDAGASFVKSG